ncbi:hypothetical protein EXE43_12900 [Halorubrum sp. SS5]|nr:hypothetical protein EXE43_12900 [Halorubrum sp. SS5]
MTPKLNSLPEMISNNMLSEDDAHRLWAENEIKGSIEKHEYAPILFVGSGLSRRYLDAPNWRTLLKDLVEMCPEVDEEFEYLEEEFSEPEIASYLVEPFREWAWNDRGDYDEFDPEIFEKEFEEGREKEKYLKYKVAEYFEDLSPNSDEDLPEEYRDEIAALRRISPEAVVTTNYDTLLETLFPGFETMVGQEIYHSENKTIGDLFKIHGSIDDFESIILTKEDYDDFKEEKKYISAKLLTYFTEHPVLILGHSASDDNIRRILDDLDRMIPTKDDDLIDNLFLVDYEDDEEELEGDPNLGTDELIQVDDQGRTVRVNSVTANSFKWVFESFEQGEPLEQAEVEQIREFRNRIYDITTKDAPRRKVNFERLEYFSDEDNIEKLLGFVPIDNPETVEGLRKAGVPIGEGEVSTEAVDDINARLNTATQNYNSNGNLISDRGTVLEFRKRSEDLELTEDKCELLIRSSMSARLQGADWIVKYPGDPYQQLEDLIHEPTVGAHVIQRLETTLFVLGQQELLQELYRAHADNGLLSGGLDERCGDEIIDRLEQYGASDNILFMDDNPSVGQIFEESDMSEIDRLLNTCGDILIEEDQSDQKGDPSNAVDFRKLEIIKLAKGML